MDRTILKLGHIYELGRIYGIKFIDSLMQHERIYHPITVIASMGST